MYGNFKERAIGNGLCPCTALRVAHRSSKYTFVAVFIEYVKEAVNEDKNENYERAFELYMTALEYFKTHLKYEKNPRSKEAITLKVWCCVV